MGLDPADSRPAYRQLAERLRHQIATGRLASGDQLPSLATLTSDYDISPMTARAAIRELTSEGLVVVRQGHGAFVLDGAAERTRLTLNDLAELLQRISTQVEHLTDRVAALEADHPTPTKAPKKAPRTRPAPKRTRGH